ncbi:MAG: hypothetical protein WB696_29150 [Chthoniobacterales bacterium]
MLALEADILAPPEFLDLVALNDLSAANNVDSFTVLRATCGSFCPNQVAKAVQFKRLWLPD